MGVMLDLTLKQISARCTNKEISKYIASMAELPQGISVCKFLVIFLHSARKAQLRLNAELAEKGNDRRLETYSLPERGVKVADKQGIHFQVLTYKVVVVVSQDKEKIEPVYSTSI
ncbi:hypothetical protein [Nostoc sp.]|uniref:hypothetical protein n=1 Tax=Nostoc sp. TaxID=1180 RepID=UPI002FFBBC1C